jgi:hypothetical protein
LHVPIPYKSATGFYPVALLFYRKLLHNLKQPHCCLTLVIELIAAPLSDKVEGYAALTTGYLQIGANVNISKSFTGNLFYRTVNLTIDGALVLV